MPVASRAHLLERWRDLIRDCRAGDRTGAAVDRGRQDPLRPEEAGRDLLSRWDEPHRRYHNLEHLTEVLDAVDLLAGQELASGQASRQELAGPRAGRLAPADLAAVRLAAWFHDAVYQGRPGADEEASAHLAASLLPALGVPRPCVDSVLHLVRVTMDHRPEPDDQAAALLCDADLAVLAADPERYARYAGGIRAEYAHVPDPAFRAGRTEVLRRLTSADTLYRTRTGRDRWEARARANIAAELATLADSARPID